MGGGGIRTVLCMHILHFTVSQTYITVCLPPLFLLFALLVISSLSFLAFLSLLAGRFKIIVVLFLEKRKNVTTIACHAQMSSEHKSMNASNGIDY